jgi:Mn2+/Fe2+ NRAMP family transporter
MIDKITSFAISFYHEYSIIVIIIAVIILIVAYNKPKESFKFAIFLVIMVCVLYAVDLFGGSIDLGKQNKNQMVHKTNNLDD